MFNTRSPEKATLSVFPANLTKGHTVRHQPYTDAGFEWSYLPRGRDSPGPQYAYALDSTVGKGFYSQRRNHPVDNMVLSLRTATETPGPGAHHPREATKVVRGVRFVSPAVRKLCPVGPGPSCYDTARAAKLTRSLQPRCTFSRASRSELFPQPRAGEASPGPAELTVADYLASRRADKLGPLRTSNGAFAKSKRCL